MRTIIANSVRSHKGAGERGRDELEEDEEGCKEEG
jgi:hypothetical protein